MGIALGGMGLTLDEFCDMSYDEFEAVQRAWVNRRDADFKNQWEQTRAMVMAAVTPHMDKRHRITAEQLMPFPWDNEHSDKADAKPKTANTDWRARADALAKKLGAKTTKDGK